MDQGLPLLQELIEHFRKLPGVGEKTARRLTFAILDMDDAVTDLLGILRQLIGEDITLDFQTAGQPLWVKIAPGDRPILVVAADGAHAPTRPKAGRKAKRGPGRWRRHRRQHLVRPSYRRAGSGPSSVICRTLCGRTMSIRPASRTSTTTTPTHRCAV